MFLIVLCYECICVYNSKLIVIISEILFVAKSGHKSNRIQMESLGQHEPVLNNILDTWGEVLNFSECQRSATSPLRYFLPTFEVVSVLISNFH